MCSYVLQWNIFRVTIVELPLNLLQVSKTFNEFEELYKRLYKRFPSVNFPPLPGKSLFSQNPSGQLECMDKVLKLVASTVKLSSSPMVISFLRGDPLPKELPDPDPEVSNSICQKYVFVFVLFFLIFLTFHLYFW